jgi:hypothetical protein
MTSLFGNAQKPAGGGLFGGTTTITPAPQTGAQALGYVP